MKLQFCFLFFGLLSSHAVLTYTNAGYSEWGLGTEESSEDDAGKVVYLYWNKNMSIIE